MSEVLAPELPQESALASFWLRNGVPIVLALFIHLLAALMLVRGWASPSEPARVQRFEAVTATLLALEQKAPAPKPAAARPQPAAPLPTKPEPARPQPQKAPSAAAPPAKAEPKPAPPEVKEAAPPVQDDAWREALDASLDSAISEEASLMAAAEADVATASFVSAIVRRIEGNWSRPPSARNGMQAELLIALVPTGDLVSVDIVRSSGNPAFDRSAETAVRRAAPFEVPTDGELFESRFRNLRILFHPEDLRK
ncbi:MAG TPA: cell envelope integrity protein TolA [Pseudomonadales bacterium]|nr:cell envelope integrity protein TolA [Pseudomonadales bacterium]